MSWYLWLLALLVVVAFLGYRVWRLEVLVARNRDIYLGRVDVAIENLQKGRSENILRIIWLLKTAYRLGVCAEKVAYRINDLQPHCDDHEEDELRALTKEMGEKKKRIPVTIRVSAS